MALAVPARAQVPESTVPWPRYGDARTHHVGFSAGFGGGGNGFVWALGAEYGRFLLPGVAPTVELDLSGGSQVLTVASTMVALRWLPWRGSTIWPLLVPRAGRLFVADSPDLWGAGGTVGFIIALDRRIGLQIAYEYLRLFPDGDCERLTSGCDQQRWGVGLVLGF